jgi:hypothetical protein
VIPPPPVKHILSSFTLSNPRSKRAIEEYVEWQARGEKVHHAEKIKSEHLFGQDSMTVGTCIHNVIAIG